MIRSNGYFPFSFYENIVWATSTRVLKTRSIICLCAKELYAVNSVAEHYIIISRAFLRKFQCQNISTDITDVVTILFSDGTLFSLNWINNYDKRMNKSRIYIVYIDVVNLQREQKKILLIKFCVRTTSTSMEYSIIALWFIHG